MNKKIRERIESLRCLSGNLKLEGKFKEILPLRVELAELMERHSDDYKKIASSWNYVAYVNVQIKAFEAAEIAARKSLSVHLEYTTEKDENTATYLMMMCKVLACQNKFVEAHPYGKEAVDIYRRSHGDDNDFVKEREKEVEEIFHQRWKG